MTVNERKGKSEVHHEGQEEQRSWEMMAYTALKHMCSVSCQQHTHNYLMTKSAGSTPLSLVSDSISHSHCGVDSVLTHSTTHHISPSIRPQWWEWVRWLQASWTIGAFDRWSRQNGRQDDAEPPLYHCHWPLLSFLSFSTFFPTFPLSLRHMKRLHLKSVPSFIGQRDSSPFCLTTSYFWVG